MKRIKLTQNQYTLVDDWNYERLSNHKWCACWNPNNESFYAVRGHKDANNKWCLISMHREILGLSKGDKRQADHINHNTLDNREANLRIVTNSQNHYNRRKTKGYCWHKMAKKYYARIKINGQTINLGLFDTASKARAAYLKAKKKYHKIGV